MLIALYLCATNDRNGNPRRGWAILRPDGRWTTFLAYVDEGYSGRGALKEYAERCHLELGSSSGIVEGPRINVSAGEWNAWRREAPDTAL